MTCTPRCQDQHPGQLRQGSVVLTTSPLNIDDTVSVVFIVLRSFSALTCLAAFTVFTSLFGGLCVVSDEWKWNKSLFIFLKLFPPCLLHSTLLPLPWPHLFYLPLLNSPFPFLLLLLISCLSPQSCLLLDFIFSSNFGFLLLSSPCSQLSSPLQNALWCRRLLALFTKNKVIWYCWKQEKKFSLVPVIENRITVSPMSHLLLSNF